MATLQVDRLAQILKRQQRSICKNRDAGTLICFRTLKHLSEISRYFYKFIFKCSYRLLRMNFVHLRTNKNPVVGVGAHDDPSKTEIIRS